MHGLYLPGGNRLWHHLIVDVARPVAVEDMSTLGIRRFPVANQALTPAHAESTHVVVRLYAGVVVETVREIQLPGRPDAGCVRYVDPKTNQKCF